MGQSQGVNEEFLKFLLHWLVDMLNPTGNAGSFSALGFIEQGDTRPIAGRITGRGYP
jgi:hypothetical protein